MRTLFVLVFLPTVLVAGSSATAGQYPDRFVWIFGWSLDKDADVAEITQLLGSAAQHGINGAVLSAGLDALSHRSPDYFRRLGEIEKTCNRLKVELIPAIFSVGYGSPALGFNRMLAEGIPVTDAPFRVKGSQARLVPDASVKLANSSFEEVSGNRFKGYNFHDQPGEISFVDTAIKHSGNTSLRMENFRANPYGHGRVMQEIHVRPHRCYRISVWVKTEDLQPAGAFRMLALANDRELAPREFDVPSTSDWHQLSMLVNSLDIDTISLYVGVWGGKKGRFWLDDLSIEEIGPLNVLRRPGTPVTVKSEDGQVIYEENRDFAPLRDPQFSFYQIDRPSPPLQVLPHGRIKDDQKLLVSWYHPMVVHSSQVSVCMGEPELYEILDREAKALSGHLHPRRVLLNMDEIRMGGTCRACEGKEMGRLLGQCISREVEIVRRHIPGCQVYIWSDMLDPNHNAHGNYYLVKGSFADSWKHVPRDLRMAVWGGEVREKSLKFFQEEGFDMLVACYYDSDNLNDVRDWLTAANPKPKVRGFMYTPWQKKYQLLPPFGDMIGRDR
jgi:hypothetical protein